MTLAQIAGGENCPPEPDWSQVFSDPFDLEAAHETWGVAVREMQDAGTLVVANGHAVKRLVEFRVQYERASREVAEHGPILKAKRTRVPQYSPHWIVMRQADDSIRALEAELGIAPARRGKAQKVQRGKKAPRAADRFLQSVPK